MDSESSADKPIPAISQAIQALLDRHGVPERRRLMVLESALGVAYQQVRRRMMGETPWSVEEVQRIASHFGEPALRLLGAMVDEHPGEAALLRVGDEEVCCSIWLGSAGTRGIGPYVALRVDQQPGWRVVLASEVKAGAALPVRRLVVEPEPAKRVAVIDDDLHMGQAIVEFLQSKGLEAIAYRQPEQVREALETTHFDGFILDWVLGAETAVDLLPLLRSRNPSGPIIILTGQIGGGAKESDVASALKTHRLQLFEKPTRTMVLFHALELGFQDAKRAL
jgi:CheY-like chemotaxis protein